MPRSQSDTADLLCPACGTAFRSEVWLIVDRSERPDLVARILDGTLHRARCPGCHMEGAINHPLLLHDDARQHVVAALPLTVQHERAARELIGDLLQRLVDALPPAERQAYLGEVELTPELDGLRTYLLAQDNHPDQATTERRLALALEALLNARDSAELEHIIATYRAMLLDDQAAVALARVAMQAESDGDRVLHQRVQQARALILRLRTAWRRRRATLERLTDQIEPFAAHERELLPVLQRICAAIDPQEVYAERIRLDAGQREALDRLLDRLSSQAHAQDEAEAEAFLRAVAASVRQ